MKNEFETNLPYEENDESFGCWFRESAKDKWEKYLSGDEKDLLYEERLAMRKFLVEHGTKEEIQQKLDSFRLRILPEEALLREIRAQRPDLELDPEYKIEF